MEIMNNTQRDLPNSTTVLVLGILSLIFCWCYGFIGLILGIIALVIAGNQRRIYLESPSEYTDNSFRNVNSGRTCAIIAICISAFIVVFWILMIMGILALGLGAATCRF